MKKRITGLALCGMILIANPTYAAFGGFRVGLDLGMQILRGHHSYTAGVPASDQHIRYNALSSVFGGHGGYLFEINSSKMVIGIEAYLLMLSASPSRTLNLVNGANTPEGRVNIKHASSMGLAGTVGLMLNPKILVYLNLGLEMAKFKLKYDMTLSGLPPSENISKNFLGFVPAIGADYKISSHFLVGMQLSYLFVRKALETKHLPLRSYNYKPSEGKILIRLTYLF